MFRLASCLVVLSLAVCSGPGHVSKTPWRYEAGSADSADREGGVFPTGGPANPWASRDAVQGLWREPIPDEQDDQPNGLDDDVHPPLGPLPPHAATPPALQKQKKLFLQWPLPATGVNSLFGARYDPVDGSQRFHYGIDLQGGYGAPVASIAPGVVARAGWAGGHGRHVVLDHPAGYRSVYSHLSQTIVFAGQTVKTGQAIGLVGNSGRSTGPHLHFELLRYNVHLDPLDFLGSFAPVD